MDGRMEGWKDGRTDGRMEIHPCVLQDIGPLGPLPKKDGVCISPSSFRWGEVGQKNVARTQG